MLRMAVVVASLGVLLVVGALFMPGGQVAPEAGWMEALKSRVGEVFEEKVAARVPVLDGGRSPSPAVDAAPVTAPAADPPQTAAAVDVTEGSQRGGEPHDAASGVDERDWSPPQAHEAGGELGAAEVPGNKRAWDEFDEDGESAIEVLERVGRRINGRG